MHFDQFMQNLQRVFVGNATVPLLSRVMFTPERLQTQFGKRWPTTHDLLKFGYRILFEVGPKTKWFKNEQARQMIFNADTQWS